MDDDRKEVSSEGTNDASEGSTPNSTDPLLPSSNPPSTSDDRSLSQYHGLDDVSTASIISRTALGSFSDVPGSDQTPDSAITKPGSSASSRSNDRFSITVTEEVDIHNFETEQAVGGKSRSQSPKTVKFATLQQSAGSTETKLSERPKRLTGLSQSSQTGESRETSNPFAKQQSLSLKSFSSSKTTLSPQSQKSFPSSKNTLSPQSQISIHSSKSTLSPRSNDHSPMTINDPLQNADEIEELEDEDLANQSQIKLLPNKNNQDVINEAPIARAAELNDGDVFFSNGSTPPSDNRNKSFTLRTVVGVVAITILISAFLGFMIGVYMYRHHGYDKATSTTVAPHRHPRIYSNRVITTQAPLHTTSSPTETTSNDAETTTFQPPDTTMFGGT